LQQVLVRVLVLRRLVQKILAVGLSHGVRKVLVALVQVQSAVRYGVLVVLLSLLVLRITAKK
jgi:hypothetical protein